LTETERLQLAEKSAWLSDQTRNEERFDTIFKAMDGGDFPSQKVFFEGRHYDGWSFAVKLAVKATSTFHDRFLILDGNEFYHFGASLKDLGRKYCAVSKLDAVCIPSTRADLKECALVWPQFSAAGNAKPTPGDTPGTDERILADIGNGKRFPADRLTGNPEDRKRDSRREGQTIAFLRSIPVCQSRSTGLPIFRSSCHAAPTRGGHPSRASVWFPVWCHFRLLRPQQPAAH
jgi:hypothetical protein